DITIKNTTLKHQSAGPECPSDSIPYVSSIQLHNGNSKMVNQNAIGSEITIIVTPAAMCARVRFLEEDLMIRTAKVARRIATAKEVTKSGTFISVFRFGIAERQFVTKICISENRFSKVDNRSCRSFIGVRRFQS